MKETPISRWCVRPFLYKFHTAYRYAYVIDRGTTLNHHLRDYVIEIYSKGVCICESCRSGVFLFAELLTGFRYFARNFGEVGRTGLVIGFLGRRRIVEVAKHVRYPLCMGKFVWGGGGKQVPMVVKIY